MSNKNIEQVRQAHSERLMSLPGVVGVGIGESDGQPCIIVLVAMDNRALRDQIPTELDGFPVTVEETGEFRALSDD